MLMDEAAADPRGPSPRSSRPAIPRLNLQAATNSSGTGKKNSTGNDLEAPRRPDGCDEETSLVYRPGTWTRKRIFLLVVCSANSLVWSLLYVAFVPLLPYYAKSFDLDSWHQCLLVAVMQVGWLLAFPVFHSALLRARHTLYLGAVAYTVAPLILGFAARTWHLFAARILEGFGACLLMSTCDAMLARHMPAPLRGRAFGIQMGVKMSGFLYGPLASGFLLPRGGIQLVFGIISIVAGLALVLYCFIPEAWFRDRDENLEEDSARRFSKVLNSTEVCALLLLQFFAFAMSGIFWVAMPMYLEGPMAVSAMTMSLIWLCFDIFKMVCSILGGSLADFQNPWVVTIAGFCVMGCSSVLLGVCVSWKLGLTHVLLVAGLMVSMGGAGGGAVGPAFTKVLVELTRLMKTSLFEEMLTLGYLTATVALLLGNLYAGHICVSLGYEAAFVLFGVMELLALACCAVLTRRLYTVCVPDPTTTAWNQGTMSSDDEELTPRTERRLDPRTRSTVS